MKLSWTDEAWEDYLHWHEHDARILKRINELVRATLRKPFHGLGAPEALKFNFAKCWSRRINRVHRLVYTIEQNQLIILLCRHHH